MIHTQHIGVTMLVGLLTLFGNNRHIPACHITDISASNPPCQQVAGETDVYDCPSGVQVTYTASVTAASGTPAYQWLVDDGTFVASGAAYTDTLGETGRHTVKAKITCSNGDMHSKRVFPTIPFTVAVDPQEGGRLRAEPGKGDGIDCGVAETGTSLCTEDYRRNAESVDAAADEGWVFIGGTINGVWMHPANFIQAVTEGNNALVTAKPTFVKTLTFQEHPTQTMYGFDDFSEQHLPLLPEDERGVWKSVEAGWADAAQIWFEPTSAPLTMDDLTFPDADCAHIVKSSDTEITVVGDATDRCQVQARYKKQGIAEAGPVVGNLRVAVYKKRKYRLSIRSATKTLPEYPLPNRDILKNYLNDIFLQGIREWEDVRLLLPPLITEEFDVDGDGCVDVTDDPEDEDESEKLLALHGGKPDDWEKIVFLVKCIDHNGKAPLGVAPMNGRVAFVKGELSQEERLYVIAHELGHAFGLNHVCSPDPAPTHAPCEPVQYQGEDRDNIMHPGVVYPLPPLPRLRFWQWEFMKTRLQQ